MKFVKAILSRSDGFDYVVLVNLDKVELVTRVDDPELPPFIWVGDKSYECVSSCDEVDDLKSFIIEI